MKWPRLEDINSEHFLNEAFDAERNEALSRQARVRRDTYMGLFLSGIACVIGTAVAGRTLLCVLSLFLGTLSLVVMTKYDTRLHFLRVLRRRGEQPAEEDHLDFDPER